MTQNGTESLVELEDFLDDQRDALKTGDIEALARIAARSDAISARLDAAACENPAELARLRTKAVEVLRQIDFALRGIRAARRRIAAIMTARQTLSSYDRDGRPASVGASPGSVEWRG